jgi:hypothetical protein
MLLDLPLIGLIITPADHHYLKIRRTAMQALQLGRQLVARPAVGVREHQEYPTPSVLVKGQLTTVNAGKAEERSRSLGG